MKVFISWSGEQSFEIGKVFGKYLPCIIQSCDPFYSPEMERGIRWFKEIGEKLEETNVGIICLTKENLTEPWILFESGALAKNIEKSRLCTFLYDLEHTDITDPLAQFNHTPNTKEGILKLLKTINSKLDTPLSEKVLEETFDTWWPKIERDLSEIPKPSEIEEEPLRKDREILDEILEKVRSFSRPTRPLDVRMQETPLTVFGLQQPESSVSSLYESFGTEYHDVCPSCAKIADTNNKFCSDCGRNLAKTGDYSIY